ncbi:unnamed protein product [Caenorhabditis auriculariae]|uniref:Fragile site-associated protein C-terminal domain-containing protein n=1 Tax=Caenorhabditis auriculariae TaxID=2777116 RepID=A0A8S1H9V4_9PELO|nr:unnamed protein product [Caenorhabditis auriculariae]
MFSFWILILALTSFLAWGVFHRFVFFSRVVGIFLTFFLDKYLRLSKKMVYIFRIGGISISGLHVGKIMFRNVVYANNDFVVKINDGYFIFKFWKTIKSRRLKLDEKRSPRLLVSLNGFQIHVFNNMAKYSEIARICGADWFFANTGVDPKRPPKPPDSTPPSAVWENVWNLLGMLDLRISSGWLLAGNRLLPNALWLRLENLSCKIGVSESANDRALLTCEGDTESVSISLIKNEETTGDTGFPVLQTASLQFVLEQDILGYVVDEEQQSIDAKVPKWSSEWKFHNNTVISYGPWAEQQRMLIYNFFFPPDYQAKVILMKESCVDLWFERGEQLESIRTRCAPGSFIDFSVLWIVTDNGFHWNVHAEFLKIESTTSLLFTKLLESEKFVVKGSFEYPKVFNAEQNWKIDYTFSKATCWFVWDHKRFFTDLINDWVGDEPADIIKFIPFRVHNTLIVKDSFEILLLLNECNWVDPADKNAENVEAAIVGQELIFEFVMPFVEFLPEFVRVKYSMRAKGELAMRMKYPPDSATAPMLAALARSARTRSFAKKSSQGTHSCNKDEWFETWRTKSISMKFDHSYHPIVGKIKSQLPEQVEREFLPPKPDHPWKCAPDQLTVDIFIDGSEMKFTGLLVKLILELKNNYFGWYDSMTNIDSYPEDVTKVKSAFNRVPPNANPENYRPMDVDVSVRVCNTRALMLVYSPAMDASQENCPVVLAEEIVVEVKKSTTQSLIQVGTSPIAAYFDSAAADRPAGCLTLSGVQFRGQAMYSSKDVAWDMGLIEYGWLMEVLVGDLAGTLDFPHHLMALHQIVETILILALSPDDEKIVPVRMQFCQHGQLSRACTMSKTIGGTCETEERQKYRQLRVAVDSVHLSLGEDKTLFDVTIDPMRFTLCNAHESKFTEHLCLRLPKISVRQAYLMNEKTERNRWIQCASVEIAGVSLDVELPPESGDRPDHEKVRKEFVCGHDEASKRLHFLWEKQTVWGCACYGNTFFFGSNDSIGSIFLDCAPGSKLFVPGIEKDPKSQPKVLQSVLNKESSMLLGQSHNFYKQTRAKEQAYMAQRRSSEDTTSFHSAFSQQLYGTRLTNSNELMTTYGEFIHNLTIYPTEPIMPPYFSQPGAIESWCKAHQPPDFILDQEKQGVNEVHLTAKNKAPSARISSPAVRKSQPNDTQEEFESPNVRTKSPHQLHKQRRVSVNGVAASSVNIFFSPLALEACERLLTTTTNAISGTNPCLLVQMCYRDCVLRKHRQPLIEPLFSDDETPTELDIAVDLPQIRMGLFQCGFRKHLSTNMVNDETITANLALVLVDRAWILSKTVATTEMPTTMYQLNFNVLTAQLLQLTRRDGPDFSGHGSVTTCVNWDSCAIASRMKNCEPRVVLDFNVPDVSILLERKAVLVQAHARPLATTPVQTPTTPVNLNSPAEKPSRLSAVFGGASAEKAAEKVQPPSTPTPQASQKKAPLRVLRLSHEHVVRVVVGSVNASVVMARPQEMTAGDEFPIYEALSPVIISWLSVVDNFVYVVEKLAHDLECWRNVAMAKILKLALDCTDDKVAVKCGKNRMLAVKVLGKHQASCASCLLLHTLFRWFAYSQAAPIAQCSSICIRNEFEPSRTRKTALMALLSHWQPDIGRHLKLVSYDEASKFKVNRIPGKKRENSADEISIDSKNGKKETKKETKIIVEEPKGLRNSLEKLTPPMLRRRGNRKKGGQDEEDDGGAILEEGFDQTPGQTYVPPVFIEKMHAEHEDMSRKKFEEFDRMMEMDDESSNDGTSRMTNAQNNEPKVDEQKMDLYTWMRNAQKEKPYRAKAAGENILSEVDAAKDYVNPMDIQQKAFFYSLYRWARLEWFALDDVVVDRISMEYSAILKEIDVKMLAKRVKSSTDQSRQFITPAQHQVMLLRNAVVSGQLLWQLERDEKRRLPLSGKWTVNYTGNVENVRFLIGLATVSLGKELSLVLQAASEAHAEMKKLVAVARTPRINRMPPIVYAQAAEWDDKVLEMTRDYEKHLQRMTKSDQEAKVQTVVNGTVSVTSVMLESMLTDLYVSVMIHKIDLSQSKRPPEAIRSQTSVTNTGANVTASHDDKKATLTRKQTTPISVSASHIDDILLSLSRASLTLSEADSASKKSDIFRCTLNTSSLNFYRRLKSNSVRNKQPKNAKGDGRNSKIETWITLKFGALDGVMPMAAHSLHDVVMRHGKELEQQLNRLAAQPAGTTPTTTPTVDSATVLKPRSSVQEEESTQKPTPQQSMPPSHEAFSILQPIPATSSTTTALFSHRRTPSAAFPHPQQLALNRRTPIAVVNFVLDVASIEMNIQLLPSLQAKYRINRASSAGVTGNQANWNVIIDEHFFEFCVTAMSGQTETFRLQLPSVKCFGKYTVEQGTDKNKPSTDKKLLYREGGFLQTTVVLGHVNHTFTTDLLNQLLFAEQSFRSEFTSLINRIRPSVSPSRPQKSEATTADDPAAAAAPASKPPLLFSIKLNTKDVKMGKEVTPWLQLTASTPTHTAVRFTIDNLEGELTNKWVVKEEGSKERIYGNAVVHFNAKLGQLVKAAQYDEVSPELQEYATFMTQVRVENKDRNMLNSSYSYHISLNRPILLVKANAIDKAILLWLNYKNTYDYWRSERNKVVQEVKIKQEPSQNTVFSPPIQDVDMNLSLAINNGMYMCMPLYTCDVTEGMPALVISLQKSELSVLVKRELSCKASFESFKLSFIDDFDEQALSESFREATGSMQTNYFYFPQGRYTLYSLNRCPRLATACAILYALS